MDFAVIGKAAWRILRNAIGHFSLDDGWAMASHVALTTLMALFPFLIFAASLASFLHAEGFTETVLPLLFEVWPKEVAGPIVAEVRQVLAFQRGGLLTVTALAAAFFASSGVEALRTSLNRAYRMRERRSAFRLRLESVGFVLLATATLLLVSLLLVALPIAARLIASKFPDIRQMLGDLELWRYLIATAILITGLTISHLFLPAGQRRVRDILPGVVLTIGFWIAGSAAFVSYLESFASYTATYAGLASIMIALVFLYMVSVIFILGGELNAAIMRYRNSRRPA